MHDLIELEVLDEIDLFQARAATEQPELFATVLTVLIVLVLVLLRFVVVRARWLQLQSGVVFGGPAGVCIVRFKCASSKIFGAPICGYCRVCTMAKICS